MTYLHDCKYAPAVNPPPPQVLEHRLCIIRTSFLSSKLVAALILCVIFFSAHLPPSLQSPNKFLSKPRVQSAVMLLRALAVWLFFSLRSQVSKLYYDSAVALAWTKRRAGWLSGLTPGRHMGWYWWYWRAVRRAKRRRTSELTGKRQRVSHLFAPPMPAV